jgi:nucleoside-diphosphate-sugar epimerase
VRDIEPLKNEAARIIVHARADGVRVRPSNVVDLVIDNLGDAIESEAYAMADILRAVEELGWRPTSKPRAWDPE